MQVAFEELLDLCEEMNNTGNHTNMTIDGTTYSSDFGYAMEGVYIFIDVLARRHNYNYKPSEDLKYLIVS